MARARSPHEADCSGRARRYSSALLLLAIASLLVACGGGNKGPGPGGGGGGAVVCTTGPAPAVLTWDTVSDPDLLGYRIYYGTAPGMYFQPRGGGDPVNVTTYTVMGLTSGTTYYFATTAYGTTQFESAFLGRSLQYYLLTKSVGKLYLLTVRLTPQQWHSAS